MNHKKVLEWIYDRKRQPYARAIFEENFEYYVRFFFWLMNRKTFIVNWHHKVLFRFFEDVAAGKITRGIINIPPRYGKTEIMNLFMSWTAAKFGNTKDLHISYSEKLVFKNSRYIKDITQTREYQILWPSKLKKRAAQEWSLDTGREFYCAPSGGSITGFGAGHDYEGGEYDENGNFRYGGCIGIDDLIKPKDANSEALRSSANDNYSETISSRINSVSTAILYIGQRVHDEDITAVMVKGKTGDKWVILIMPVLLEDNPYADLDTSYATPYEYDWESHRGPLWEHKHDLETINKVLKANPYVYNGQYKQNPAPKGEGKIKAGWFQYYQGYSNRNIVTKLDGSTLGLTMKVMTIDTAMTASPDSDASVLLVGGLGSDGNLYIIDMLHGRWELTDLKDNFLAFSEKHMTGHLLPLMERHCELKANGHALKSWVNRMHSRHHIQGIERNISKSVRVAEIVYPIFNGMVYLPKDQPWVKQFVDEVTSFNDAGTHKHDDITDTLCDMVSICLTDGVGYDYY